VIEIPGYRVIRTLGRGGMATVYLALQESVDREVALKVMSPALMVDPNFGERFLREARIAAKLHHRHVVGVHDVGKHNDIHYIAMEYLPGGSPRIEDKNPLEATFVLRVIREIATALGYAHSKGFVHRDVKPDNILLHDDGTAALTDFGIARASDSATRMTRTGSVIGTPYYMSPEQARGKPLDGRADLYSLGVVLYEMLTGSVPYLADDPLAIGIMHITEPVPRLPPMLQPLQGLLDRMMAKLPEERFQTGEEIADIVREIEMDIAEGQFPQIAVPSDTYRRKVMAEHSRTQRLQGGATPKPDQQGYRSEPSLGRVEDVVASERRPRSPQSRSTPDRGNRPLWPMILGITVVVLIGIAVLFREPLGKLLSPGDVAESLAKAETAVREQRFYGSPDSALEYYRQVIAVDPDNSTAKVGISNVGNKLVMDATDRVSAGEFDKARELLGMAKEVLGGGTQVEELETRLNDKESAAQNIEDLMVRAQAALVEKRLTGIDGALDLFGRVIDTDASNFDAVKGQKEALNEVAILAEAAVDAGDFAKATQLVDEIARVSANHVSLANLRPRIADGQSDVQESMESDLRRAEQLIGERAFYQPANNNALSLLRSVLERDPNNLRAKNNIARIASELIVEARAYLNKGDLEGAKRLLQKAEELGASGNDVRQLKTDLRETAERIDIQSKTKVLTISEMQKIDKLLGDAERAMNAGNLIEPVAENAHDKYRSVLAIDRNNPKAKAGIAALPAKAKILYEQALSGTRLNAAYEYLDTVLYLAPSEPTGPDMRTRLAVAYVEQAREKLAAGQMDAAKQAWTRARNLEADVPGITELASQLGGQ